MSFHSRSLLTLYLLCKSASYKSFLSPEGRKLYDKRIPRCALRKYEFSPFKYLYDSGNDQALMNMTGLTHARFNEIIALYTPYYNRYTWDRKKKGVRKLKVDRNGQPRHGRKRHMDAVGSLGLVFTWYRTTGPCTRTLALAFGLTSSQMYEWLKYGRRVLLKIMMGLEEAAVSLPTKEEIQNYTVAIETKYPLMRTVWGACDGVKLCIEASGDYEKQEAFYNGWTHGHYASCVFVFAADGRICICTVNSPGSWHDSAQADYGVYQGMKEVYEMHGGKVVVDSAFNLKNCDYLIKSSQQHPQRSDLYYKNKEATSVRQLSEWGMRMIQAQFPRLKDKLLLNLMVQCSDL